MVTLGRDRTASGGVRGLAGKLRTLHPPHGGGRGISICRHCKTVISPTTRPTSICCKAVLAKANGWRPPRKP
jgi:hypothetical protein